MAILFTNTILILITYLSNNVYSNPLFLCGVPLTILHSNDINSRYREISPYTGRCIRGQNCYGGLARIAHVVNSERQKEDAMVLYLIAGNTFTSGGRSTLVAEIVNKVAPNAISLGVNEFDRGIGNLISYIEKLEVPIVCSNMVATGVPILKKKVKKSIILEVNKVKVGIVGYIRQSTEESNVGNLIFENEIMALKRETKKLESEGVRIIIALGHAGFEMDKKIAATVPYVDLVIGGGENTLLWNGKQPDVETKHGPYPTVIHQKSGVKVPVVHVFGYTKYIGKILVNFSSTGGLLNYEGNPILLSRDIPQDPEVLAMGSGEKINARNIYIVIYLIIFFFKF